MRADMDKKEILVKRFFLEEIGFTIEA